MERQRQVAELALLDVAARRAVDVRGEAAAVEQQDHLAAVVERLLHRPFQRRAEAVQALVRLAVVPQVDQVHLRQRPVERRGWAASAACTGRAGRCASFPATASPSRAGSGCSRAGPA